MTRWFVTFIDVGTVRAICWVVPMEACAGVRSIDVSTHGVVTTCCVIQTLIDIDTRAIYQFITWIKRNTYPIVFRDLEFRYDHGLSALTTERCGYCLIRNAYLSNTNDAFYWPWKHAQLYDPFRLVQLPLKLQGSSKHSSMSIQTVSFPSKPT